MAKAVDSAVNTIRYERKFVYPGQTVEDLIDSEVLCNSFCFREIFHRRTVNNLYLDDPNMTCYHQNVAGDEERQKYRFRWYGDTFSEVNSPTVEVKKKMGTVGDKISLKLKDFKADLASSSSAELQSLIEKEVDKAGDQQLLSKLQVLRPALYNSYERRYFLSACERYRITIDYNMDFYNPAFTDFAISKAGLSDIILELKYAVADDKDSRTLAQELTARLSKNSKYVRGVDLINHRVHV